MAPTPKMRPIDAAADRAQLVQLAAGPTPGPAADLIFGDWYPACRAQTLRPGHARPVLLLGLPLLVGRRNDSTPFALRDLCPHRGIPLSAGWFDGVTVMCKYHGWRFDPCSGRCEEIPSLTSHDTLDPHKIHAGAFPTAERDGHLWVYLPPPNSGRLTLSSNLHAPNDLSFRPKPRSGAAEKPAVSGQPPDLGVKYASLPPIPETPKFSPKYRTAHLSADLPCNVDHGIIGLMDPAHGPFVHQAWWWRSAASIHEKTKHFEPIHDYYAEGSDYHAQTPTDHPNHNSAPTPTACHPDPEQREGEGPPHFAPAQTPSPTTPNFVIPELDPLFTPANQTLSFRPERSGAEKPASAPAQARAYPPAAGFRMSSHAPSSNSLPYKLLGITGDPVTTTIDFVMPNRRYETIRAGDKWFSSLTTVTPVTPSTCRIDVVAAWNLFHSVPFVTPILKFFGARFVRQDQETMIEQAQGLRFGPALMLIDDADKPAKWYFALKQARLKAQQDPTAPPTPHPLPGPTTLHWRS